MSYIKRHIQRSMDLVRNFSLEEVALFKLIMLITGLLLAKIFPVLLTANIWIYLV